MSRVMPTTISVITPSTLLAVDLDWARSHLKSVTNDEDVLIESWVLAAQTYFTEYTSRPIGRTTYELWLDGFPYERKIELPHPPLLEVVSFQYVKADGTVADVTDGGSPEGLWQSKTPGGVYARRGWVELTEGSAWPIAKDESAAVRIRYEAGYTDSDGDAPDLVKAAVMLLVGQFDQFRSNTHLSEGARLDQLPMGVDQMLAAFKYSALPSQVLHWP